MWVTDWECGSPIGNVVTDWECGSLVTNYPRRSASVKVNGLLKLGIGIPRPRTDILREMKYTAGDLHSFKIADKMQGRRVIGKPLQNT